MRRKCIIETENEDTGKTEREIGYLLGFSVDSYSESRYSKVFQYPVALVEVKDEDTGEHYIDIVDLSEDNIIFQDADDL